jgi:hypothetical protein
MSIRTDAGELQPELVSLRRALHRIPEIGLDLPRTQEAVLAALDGLPLEVSTGTVLSSVTAVLRGGAPAREGGGSRAGSRRVAARRHGCAAGRREERGGVRLDARRCHARLRARSAHGRAGRRGPPCSARAARN